MILFTSRFWSCMVVALSHLLVQAVLADEPDPPDPKGIPSRKGGDVEANYRLFGWNNCNDDEKKAIKDAFGEKDTITGIDSTWQINWSGSVAIEFFGYAAPFNQT